MTPRISESGIRLRLGESASKMNLLTPTGTGPTSRESSSWSCSELALSQNGHESWDAKVGEGLRGCRADISDLPLEVCIWLLCGHVQATSLHTIDQPL